jgi:signal transduction histidine kinase
MDREKATELLSSDDPHLRLQAARYFSKYPAPTDTEFLKAALRKEAVPWIRFALQKALDGITGDIPPPLTLTPTDTDEQELSRTLQDDDLYAKATEEISQRLVHELTPILKVAIHFAKKELADRFETSRTKQELHRIQELLSAIDKLSKAAAPPSFDEIDLASLLEQVSENESLGRDITVEKAGSSPLLVIGDKSLIDMAARNGFRNALEAAESVSDGKVIINWGKTDRDYWVAVLDNGVGLPAGSDRAFDIGSTSKEGHLGMGLALAKRAVLSLHGTIRLSPRSDGGAVYEFRWPLSLMSKNENSHS